MFLLVQVLKWGHLGVEVEEMLRKEVTASYYDQPVISLVFSECP